MSSIRDQNPVLFLEPKALYRSAGKNIYSVSESNFFIVEDVPVDDYEIKLGEADIVEEGKQITNVLFIIAVARF